MMDLGSFPKKMLMQGTQILWEGVLSSGVKATLTSVEKRFSDTADITETEDGKFIVSFSVPDESDNYNLFIAKGTFGDNKFMGSEGLHGSANADIELAYTVNVLTGMAICL